LERYARKLFHAVGVILVAVYWWGPFTRNEVAAGLAVIVAALALLDLARARNPALQALFFRLFGAITAEKDRRGWNGSTLYFSGCALTVLLFARPIACAGILCLALGDSLAAVVGMSVRSPRWRNSSLAGSTTCLAVSTASCWAFVPWPSALVGGLAATLLEAFSGTKLDNLLIPVGTAAALHLVG
jgi:dolichol kinase